MKQCVWTKMTDTPPIQIGRGESHVHRWIIGCDRMKTQWRPPHWHFCPVCGGEIVEAS